MKYLSKDKIIDKLWDIGFIGLFPGNIDTLLVPFDTAWKESNYYLRNKLTESQFKTLLREESVFVFSNVDQWEKFKNPEMWQKRRRKRFKH